MKEKNIGQLVFNPELCMNLRKVGDSFPTQVTTLVKMRNKATKNSTSFKGVVVKNGRFHINFSNKQIKCNKVGFKTAEMTALLYDVCAREIMDTTFSYNFPFPGENSASGLQPKIWQVVMNKKRLSYKY